MATVLFACPMDPDRRAALASRGKGAFDAVILEDLPAGRRDEAWSQADVLVCTGFSGEIPDGLAEKAPRLRMIQVLVAGVDHLPYDSIPRSVLVCGNAGAYNTSVAEHAMALLLAAAKDVPRLTDEIRHGTFDQGGMNRALAGSTVVVAGMGGIGCEVARLCKAFRAKVVGISRSGATVPPADEGASLDDLVRVAPRADFLVITLPLTMETEGCVDRTALGAMKPDAVLVNVARGKIVVEDDLYEHLRAHPAFRAALDVWWTYPRGKSGRPFHRPFHELPNVIMTPHIAFAIPDQKARAMDAALENVERFLRGTRPRNAIDATEYQGEGRGGFGI